MQRTNNALFEAAGVEFRASSDEWPLLRNALLTHQLSGNLVSDAWIVAAVQAASEHLVTFDRDFLRLLPARDLTLLS